MKIKAVRIYSVESGGIRPVIVELSTDQGTFGLGEVAIAYGVDGTAASPRRTQTSRSPEKL